MAAVAMRNAAAAKPTARATIRLRRCFVTEKSLTVRRSLCQTSFPFKWFPALQPFRGLPLRAWFRPIPFLDGLHPAEEKVNHIIQVESSTNTDNDRFRIKDWLLYAGLGCALILVLHFATGLGWGLSAFAILVGWPLVGTLVTTDDDLPGGWSNPGGTIPPPWRTAVALGQLSVGLAISSFVAALDTGLRTSVGVGFAVAGLAASALAVSLLHRSQH